MTGRELHWKVHEEDFNIRIEESKDRSIIYVNSQPTPFRIVEQTDDGAVIEIHGQNERVFVVRDRSGCTVWWNGRTFRLERAGRKGPGDPAALGNGEIRAAMPGRILRVDVSVGATIADKQSLLVMESMKMETTIHAPKAGRVSEVRARPGQIVELGELLVKID